MVTACKQVYVIHHQHQPPHFMLWYQQKQKQKRNKRFCFSDRIHYCKFRMLIPLLFFLSRRNKGNEWNGVPLALWKYSDYFLSFPVCCDKVTIFFHFTLIFIFIVNHILIYVLPHLEISFISFIWLWLSSSLQGIVETRFDYSLASFVGSAGLFNYKLCKRVLYLCMN